MKKLLTILTFLLTITSVSAEVIFVEANITQDNYWHKNGIETKKVLSVARKLIHEAVYSRKNDVLKIGNYTNIIEKGKDNASVAVYIKQKDITQ